jgi:crotonobetainyl-CoA:carnitine CoA-transferase CaiB-like acyl-CoA transferase
MSEQVTKREAVQVMSADKAELEELKTALSEAGIPVTPVRSMQSTTDLHLDPHMVEATLFTLTTVITHVGEALKVIDWALGKIKAHHADKTDASPPGIVIKVGPNIVEISADTDPETARKLLRAALHAV